MVIVDTDVFLIGFAFHRDARCLANAAFLQMVRGHSPAITVYNLMEILGHLSFSLPAGCLDGWPRWLVSAHDLSVVWPKPDSLPATELFHREIFDRPPACMRSQHMAFADSLVLSLAERTRGVDAIATWSATHSAGKSPLTC